MIVIIVEEVVIVADNEPADDAVRPAAARLAPTGSGSNASATSQWSSAKFAQPVPEHVDRWSAET